MENCENCSPDMSVYMNQTTALLTPPSILTLQLKRFSCNALTGKTTKDLTCVTCEKVLKFVLIDGRTASYKHIATVSHVGSYDDGGHYVAFTRLREDNCFEINDTVVTGPYEDIDIFDSLALSGGGPHNTTPYILFYDLISLEF